jgi:protein-S-isoprenylcysteine O-methyltransferase Ste14
MIPANLLAFVCWYTACTIHAYLGFTFRHGFIPWATSERLGGFLGASRDCGAHCGTHTDADAIPVAGNRSHDGRRGVVPRARYASAEGTGSRRANRVVRGRLRCVRVRAVRHVVPARMAGPDGQRRLGLVGISLGFVGIFIEIWAVWHSRFSFAKPAARRLVKTGPYRGTASDLQRRLPRIHRTPDDTSDGSACLALTGWAVCIGMRMRYEEAILTQAFPEDVTTDYRRRVGALVPWPAGEKTEDRGTTAKSVPYCRPACRW